MMTTFLRLGVMAVGLACAGACGGGQYSFAREYEPLSEENDWMERESPTTYEEVRRDPNRYRDATIGWFGVVTHVEARQGEPVRVELSFRTHQPRHLCRDETASSCRVTVSERTSGSFTAIVDLEPEDQAGSLRVWTNSLVRVYGSPTGEFDASGGPVIRARYYRHWPRGYYATTGASGTMRR